MEFKKYNIITNSYDKKTVNHILELGIQDDEWLCLNKIHGANSAVYQTSATVDFAKRTGFITDKDGNFNNFDIVFERLKDNFEDAYTAICGNEVIFYGELAGGSYPHPDVKKPSHAIRVQKCVFYNPDNFFYMFDIKVDGVFLDHDKVVQIGEDFDILVAKPLFKGTLIECFKQSCDFKDPLYKEFNLPEIEGDNFSEGLVIKPNKTHYFHNGNRVILKNKSELFKETSGKSKRPPATIHEWSVEGAKLYSLLSTYVNENRLRNVMSHGHTITQKEFGKVIGLLNKDVFDDFIKDNGDKFDCLDVVEQKLMKRKLQKLSGDVIRPHFMNIVNKLF